MKDGKHQKEKQQYCSLCWKLPDGVQSFVSFWEITKVNISLGKDKVCAIKNGKTFYPAQIWLPETNRNICFSVFLLTHGFIA